MSVQWAVKPSAACPLCDCIQWQSEPKCWRCFIARLEVRASSAAVFLGGKLEAEGNAWRSASDP